MAGPIPGHGREEHARHFDRKVDAQRWLDETTAAVVTGQYVDPRAGRETVRLYAERWRTAQPHRDSSRALYGLHLYPVLGDRAGTVFASAVADRLIAVSPFAGIKLPPVQRGKVQPPNMLEVQRLVEAAPPKLKPLIALAASRVDFLRREVRVDRQLVYIPGRPPMLTAPKTPESVRTAPLPAFVVDELAAHLAALPAGENGLMFQAEKGGPMLRTTLNGRWRRVLRRAGLAETVHLHHVRHLYASLLVGGGVPFTTVSELLGHTPQGVTWAVYTHRVEGWDRQVRTVLDRAWDAAAADCVRTSEALPASDLRR